MLYASHRLVGVMELETVASCDDSHRFRSNSSPVVRAAMAAIRRIEFELAESRNEPQTACEPTLSIDFATLQRELDAELAKLATTAGATQDF